VTKHILHILRPDLQARRQYDQVSRTACEPDISAPVNAGQIASCIPPISENLRCPVRVAPVTTHDVRPTHQQLAFRTESHIDTLNGLADTSKRRAAVWCAASHYGRALARAVALHDSYAYPLPHALCLGRQRSTA